MTKKREDCAGGFDQYRIDHGSRYGTDNHEAEDTRDSKGFHILDSWIPLIIDMLFNIAKQLFP
jgi:hypothetical protein